MKFNARKDLNQKAIVSTLQKGGAIVKDLSNALNGVPDLLVWHKKSWHLIEVKNPDTSYGKKGLNPLQKEWSNVSSGLVYIMYSEEDALNFLSGKTHKINKVGGCV